MRFLVIGAGALGGYIGGSLALNGEQVTFVERSSVAPSLAIRGLRLRLPEGEFQLNSVHVVSHLDEALLKGDFDALIFAVKSYDTLNALEDLKKHKEHLPPLLCLQNGVENESRLRAVLGEDKVIAGTVTSAIARPSAREIVLERRRGVGIAAGHPLSPRLVEAFNRAGLNARLMRSETEMKWSKLLTNLLAGASAAILDMSPAQVFAHPQLYRMEIAQLRETLHVMHAMKVDVVNLPGAPVKFLAFLVQHLPSRLSQPLVKGTVGRGRGNKMPSLHIDLHRQHGKSEVEDLNGAVVRFGARYGVPTPTNSFLTTTLLALVRGELPISYFRWQPQKLLEAYRAALTS